MINEPIPSLLPDLWNQIISYSKSNLVVLSCVDIQLNKLIHDYAKNNPPEGCFGEKEWKHFKGDPGIVFPVPLKITQDFDATKYILTFIPETLNGKPLTLTSIDEFVKNHNNTVKSNYRYKLSEYGITDKTVDEYKAHWVMLSKDVLGGDNLKNGTRNKTFEIQEKRVKDAGFEIPNLIDVVVSLFMHKMKTGEFIYPDESNYHELTFTRVQEKNSKGYRIVVGCFSALGLKVNFHYRGCDVDNIGAAGALKSYHWPLDT